MAKERTLFLCDNCGHQEIKWVGKCPQCSTWNSFREINDNKSSVKHLSAELITKPRLLSEIESQSVNRLRSGFHEFDRVLGGGIVEGSLIVFAGEPGVGKSTLLLQLLHKISQASDKKLLYITGEESEEQIADRAQRLMIKSSKISVLTCTDITLMREILDRERPGLVIVDSVQTIFNPLIQSMPGSPSQIREVTFELMNIAKSRQISIFLIGHINKEGDIAGPKLLEHMVDGVYYIEGNSSDNLRFLRSVKNRFGRSNEIAIFEMSERGMSEVQNPGICLLNDDKANRNGKALTCFAEGSRGIFVEVQSLVLENKIGNPKRIAQGVDLSRLSMILALMEKYISIKLSFSDIYINIAGGLRLNDTEADLAIIASLLSSVEDYPLPSDVLFIGEVGLSGEVRSSRYLKRKIEEAENIGYRKIYACHSVESSSSISDSKLDIINLKNLCDLKSSLKI